PFSSVTSAVISLEMDAIGHCLSALRESRTLRVASSMTSTDVAVKFLGPKVDCVLLTGVSTALRSTSARGDCSTAATLAAVRAMGSLGALVATAGTAGIMLMNG